MIYLTKKFSGFNDSWANIPNHLLKIENKIKAYADVQILKIFTTVKEGCVDWNKSVNQERSYGLQVTGALTYEKSKGNSKNGKQREMSGWVTRPDRSRGEHRNPRIPRNKERITQLPHSFYHVKNFYQETFYRDIRKHWCSNTTKQPKKQKNKSGQLTPEEIKSSSRKKISQYTTWPSKEQYWNSHNEEYTVNEFHKNLYLIILGGQGREAQGENQQNSSSTILTRQ